MTDPAARQPQDIRAMSASGFLIRLAKQCVWMWQKQRHSRLVRGGAFIGITVLLGALGPASARFSTHEQVGLVFPAYFTDDTAMGQSVAHTLKLSVQSSSLLRDPVTNLINGRAISYYIPAQMAEASHLAAERLARINGLQGTVWGFAEPLIDGVAFQSYLTLARPYEDYRTVRQEDWTVDVRGRSLRLGPPRLAVSFRVDAVPDTAVSAFGDPAQLQWCPYKRAGPCRTFSDYQVARVRSIDDSGTAVARRERKDWIVQLPNTSILSSETIDYASLFIAYARGNLHQTISLADAYFETHGDTQAGLDVYLYRAAAHARLDDPVAARLDIDRALDLNPLYRPALRYGLMVEFASENGDQERISQLFDRFNNSFRFTTDFDQHILALHRSPTGATSP